MNTYDNLIRFCEKEGFDENTAIGLLKAGVVHQGQRERAKVAEKARREAAKVALEFYRREKGLGL